MSVGAEPAPTGGLNLKKKASLTPMMRQYLTVKEEHPGAIVLFRMGDFFETFFEDAAKCSELLDITLTARSKEKSPIPMAGVPHHAIDGYVARLIDHGQTVVLVDQVEDPRQAKGLVRREVTSVVTPGTFLDPNAPPRSLSYLVAVRFKQKERPNKPRKEFGLACLDLATGEFRASSGSGLEMLVDELGRLGARELILPDSERDSETESVLARERPAVTLTFRAESEFGLAALSKQLGEDEVVGLENILSMQALSAADAILRYVEHTQLREDSWEKKAGGTLAHVTELSPYEPGSALVLDTECRSHLELLSAQDGSKRGSFVAAIDHAVTPMGGRLLVRWLLRPLVDPVQISARHDAVEAFVEAQSALDAIRSELASVYDLERIVGRIVMRRANARDLAALSASLEKAPKILAACGGADEAASRSTIATEPKGLLARIAGEDPCEDVRQFLREALVDEPGELGKDRVFREGFDKELDRLSALSKKGKGFLLEIEERERAETGISSLKVRYNKVFGYFIEVTKANIKSVPEHYIRKQTMVNAERYYTPELKKHEEEVLTAEEKWSARERDLFSKLVERVAEQVERLKRISEALATADVLASFAHLAERRGYIRPKVDHEDRIEIIDGRHPVLEQLSNEIGERFVPNDLEIGAEATLMIVTGPNMAGKSTIMRQTALIVILAQMGSFVPAKSASIGVVDRVFTRVGASDDLSKGRSTFMVEMIETARILRSATKRSLVLLDEIGRGTSTFDGLSIAWAVAEHFHDKVGAKTLFATHYHELTEICREKARAVNFHVACRELDEEIVFLRKLVEGPTNRSYGVQVARLAGLPKPIIERAKRVLATLEAHDLSLNRGSRDLGQMSLFDVKGAAQSEEEAAVLSEIKSTPIDDMTPRQALAQIAEWKELLSKG